MANNKDFGAGYVPPNKPTKLEKGFVPPSKPKPPQKPTNPKDKK